jgi:hypothetical protein
MVQPQNLLYELPFGGNCTTWQGNSRQSPADFFGASFADRSNLVAAAPDGQLRKITSTQIEWRAVHQTW